MVRLWLIVVFWIVLIVPQIQGWHWAIATTTLGSINSSPLNENLKYVYHFQVEIDSDNILANSKSWAARILSKSISSWEAAIRERVSSFVKVIVLTGVGASDFTRCLNLWLAYHGSNFLGVCFFFPSRCTRWQIVDVERFGNNNYNTDVPHLRLSYTDIPRSLHVTWDTESEQIPPDKSDTATSQILLFLPLQWVRQFISVLSGIMRLQCPYSCVRTRDRYS